MLDTHGTYEKKRNKIQKENELHLAGFEKWLKNKGLSQKTINTHVSNVDFFINDYLCYYDALDVSQGTHHIGGFLGNWFIRKAMWSSCAHIKTNAAGIKKFYAYLLENNVVEQDAYDELCWTIKDDMPDWLEEMKRYDDMIFEDYY
jgi:site-specific recombinase XerD